MGSETYVCMFEECGKKFKKPSLLELHENTHLNKRPFKCGECGASYFKNSHLKVHIKRIHEKTEARQCSECRKILASEEGLKRHREVCGRIFTCELCGADFVRAKWFITHMRKCAEPKKRKQAKSAEKKEGQETDLHRCKVCLKGFKLKKNCEFHKDHAHGLKTYMCKEEKCGKTYRYKGSLTRHIEKTHRQNSFT